MGRSAKMGSSLRNSLKVPPISNFRRRVDLVDKVLTILGFKCDNKCKLKRLQTPNLYVAPGYGTEIVFTLLIHVAVASL